MVAGLLPVSVAHADITICTLMSVPHIMAPSSVTNFTFMLSNLAGDNDVETALSKGAVKYIIKSEYEPKEIADMVGQIIAGYTRNDIPTS